MPLLANIRFFVAERARNPPSVSGWEENKAWTRELAQKWNAMSDAEKKVRRTYTSWHCYPWIVTHVISSLQPYNDQYAEARKAYVAAQEAA